MKFSVLKSKMMDKLVLAMGTVANKNTICATEGVLIESMKDNYIRISTYDMNKGFRAMVETEGIEIPGSFIVNAQRLFQTIRVFPEDEIFFDVDDNYTCTISCDKSSFSMASLRGTDFPNLPDLMTNQGFRISSPVFKRCINKVAHSVAEQDNRPMLCGAYFRLKENALDVVSCDSYTLSFCHITSEVEKIGSETADDTSFIIPGHSLGEIQKILPDGEDEKVDIYLSRKHAILRLEDIIFFTRTIDSDYIDYNRIMPKDNNIELILDRERFLDGLERATIIADEKIQGSTKSYVKLHVEDQLLTMTSVSANGKIYDEMDCVHDGGDLTIGFNCRYLINSVRVAEGENIRVTMKTPTSAITIEPTEKNEDDQYFYMILPVRMNE